MNLVKRVGAIRISWILILGGLCFLYIISLVSSEPDVGGDNRAAAARSDGNLPAVAQVTETPDAYPSAEEQTAPPTTVMPGPSTPSPESGYPAGANIDGTDRVGGDRAILGNESGSDEATEANEAGQSEQRGLGGFILWLGFLFGLIVFIAGVLFSVFLSTRDRRTNL